MTYSPTIIEIFAIFGGVVVLSYVLSFLHVFFARFIRPSKNLKKTYGTWAIVTGATDGIGKAIAMELARQGLHIILISRSKDKLDQTENEIKSKYSSILVRTIAIDYDKFEETARKKVADEIAGADIGVLVNNVGISYPFTKYFHELDDTSVRQLITLNVDSTTWMTRIVLPGMLERKRGAIINISSAAGVTVSPLLAQYSAAKSYIAMFSKALNAELKHYNIHVQCQTPLFVTTKLAKIKKASLFVPNPTSYARAAVAAIGYESLVSPFWTHDLQLWIMANLLPEWLVTKITGDMHLVIRKKGLKKEAEAAGENKDKKA